MDHFSPELLGSTLLYDSIFKTSVRYLHILHGALHQIKGTDAHQTCSPPRSHNFLKSCHTWSYKLDYT